MRLMPRDITLLRWVNEWGYVTIYQISHWLQVSRSTAYDRLCKLVHRELLRYERVFHNQPGMYRLTREGARVSQSSLPAPRHIAVGTIQHDLSVVDLSLALYARWGGQFISERQLRHEANHDGVGNTGHVNDGLFILPNKKVAIEVELSCKGKARLEKIFEHHYQNTIVDETWYFYRDNSVRRLIAPFVEKVHFIRMYAIDDFIGV